MAVKKLGVLEEYQGITAVLLVDDDTTWERKYSIRGEKEDGSRLRIVNGEAGINLTAQGILNLYNLTFNHEGGSLGSTRG